MKHLRIAIGLASALVLSGFAVRPATSAIATPIHPSAEVHGCYALFTDDGLSVGGRFYNASPLVRLDTTRYEEAWVKEGARRMIRLDAAGHAMDNSRDIVPPLWWYVPETGMLSLSFVDGFSGATLSLLVPPAPADTLRGTIQQHWDFGPPYSSGFTAAYAVRISCPRAAP